jgi:cellulose synthase/poly-beta-1,6-N-acetylglucosamine synthase-like glycosyltransferase
LSAICVRCGTYRRTALEPFGGTAAIDSEDVHTGFHVLDAGWHVKYIPVCLASGVCPDLPAFFIQQYRWAMGSTTLF